MWAGVYQYIWYIQYIYMVVKDGTEMLRWAGVYQYMMIVKDGTEDVEMVWCLSVYDDCEGWN